MLAQRVRAVRFGQRLGDDDIGGNLAAPLGERGEKRLDHRRHRKQPPIARDDGEKIPDQRRQSARCAKARHRPALLLRDRIGLRTRRSRSELAAIIARI